ncbi:uncharacterized protein LOC113667914 [Pocillopora damicornis]|uniref:uncharacterized protein LOC113667914 n=1 Tax=Pocillopora damicornis TaxID=46731 RepID=UPI000F54F4D2|nr:uncharacterized protein LOC113667914 [Pocillopora damicornis]
MSLLRSFWSVGHKLQNAFLMRKLIKDGNSPDDYLKTSSSNYPQLVCYTGRDGIQDPTSHQWFVVVDKEILLECESHLGRAVHFAFNLEYHSSHGAMFNFIHEHVLSILPKRKSYAYRKLENSFLSKLH